MWQFSMTSQFDRMDKGDAHSAVKYGKLIDLWRKIIFCCSFTLYKTLLCKNHTAEYIFICMFTTLKPLNARGEKIKHQALRCSGLMRKKRITFPSAQMESDIWRRGKIQLGAGVFSQCLQERKRAAQRTSVFQSAAPVQARACSFVT